MGQWIDLLDYTQGRIMLMRAAQRGVTVIEAMIVVALIAIIIAVGLPMTTEWLANSRIRTASESMLAGLQLARAEAVRRNDLVEFVLTGGTGWMVRTVSGTDVQTRSAGEGTADVVIAVTPDNTTRVTFDGLGRRRANIDGSASVERIDIDLPTTVLPADKSRDLRLLVGIGGQIIMCDPTVTATGDVRKCP
ncbi:MAG: GspH/FimT family pseudopilin [Rhodocyclaceae bacterium]|jgi:type IV fimbrial biogenesis protein FimT